MKTVGFLIIIFLFSGTVSEAQYVFSCFLKKKSEFVEQNFKGKVKSCYLSTYKALDNFGEIIQGDKVGGNHIYTFNENGYITDEIRDKSEGSSHKYEKKTKYNDSGKTMEYRYYRDDVLYLLEYFFYNDEGRLIEKKSYGSDGLMAYVNTFYYDSTGNAKIYRTEGDLFLSATAKFDELGNLIEYVQFNILDSSSIIIHNLDTAFISILDKNGNIIEKRAFNGKGVLERKEIFDSYGNRTEKIYYNQETQKSSDKRGYKYDENGNMTEQHFYNSNDGHLYWSNYFKYDKFGNMVELNSYDPTNLKATMKWTYVYDLLGNWIKKIEINNSAPTWITIREVSYYE